MSDAVSVLLVEDEPAISEPFAEALEREGFQTRIAATMQAAQDAFAERHPDVVLLDLQLPDGDGRDLCRALRAASSEVGIIMVTARGTETDRIVGLELGADDYVVKPFSVGEVSARIRALLRRTRPSAEHDAAQGSDARIELGELTVDLAARRAWLSGVELELRRKEYELLARLIAEPGRVVTREDLMAEVWDSNWFGPTKTLDVHVGWLRRKLGETPSAPRFIHTVRGVGFRFAAREELER